MVSIIPKLITNQQGFVSHCANALRRSEDIRMAQPGRALKWPVPQCPCFVLSFSATASAQSKDTRIMGNNCWTGAGQSWALDDEGDKGQGGMGLHLRVLA